MSSKRVTMSETRFDALLTQKWLSGQVIGAQDVAKRLRVRSGTAYGVGDDKLAKGLREVAEFIEKEIVPSLSREAQLHQEQYLDEKG